MRLQKQQILKGSEVDSLERALDKILEWFFAYPEEETSLTELCETTKTAKSNASTIVVHLQRQEFLDIHPIGRVWRIRAKKEHPFFITKKIPSNLHHIYESGVVDIILKRFPEAKTVILFGSYRKGDDISSSDIDIAVEVNGTKQLEIVHETFKMLGYKMNVPLNIHIFSRETVDHNLFANIANGIILYGFLEVKP